MKTWNVYRKWKYGWEFIGCCYGSNENEALEWAKKNLKELKGYCDNDIKLIYPQ